MLIDKETPLLDGSGSNLDYTTKIKDIIPEWKLQDPYASDNVNILDLMAHRTGLPVHLYSRTCVSPSQIPETWYCV